MRALELFFRRVVLAMPLAGCSPSSSDCFSPKRTEAVPITGDAGVLDGGVCDPLLACGSGIPPCQPGADSCELQTADGGLVASCHYAARHYACSPQACTGRRPAGLRPAEPAEAADELGAYFATMAHLEAASIEAFERLARELATHRAPASLVEAARRAARDETRHARAASELARRLNATPPRVVVRSGRERSLEAIARENAVEGCVHETYGAAVALWQARRARDLRVRRHMQTIARDERRHAELAWAVAAWASERLPRDARRRVASARATAVRRLERRLGREVHPALAREAGVPAAADARALFEMAREHLWSTFLPTDRLRS
jgi:rubrerythrin